MKNLIAPHIPYVCALLLAFSLHGSDMRAIHHA